MINTPGNFTLNLNLQSEKLISLHVRHKTIMPSLILVSIASFMTPIFYVFFVFSGQL
jgi:hypothetical protein